MEFDFGCASSCLLAFLACAVGWRAAAQPTFAGPKVAPFEFTGDVRHDGSIADHIYGGVHGRGERLHGGIQQHYIKRMADARGLDGSIGPSFASASRPKVLCRYRRRVRSEHHANSAPYFSGEWSGKGGLAARRIVAAVFRGESGPGTAGYSLSCPWLRCDGGFLLH